MNYLAWNPFNINVAIRNPTGYGGLATQGLLVDRIVTAMVIAIGILFLIYLLFGAFKYITAGGDDKAVQEAKKVLTNAGVGITIAVASFFVIDIAGEVLGFQSGVLTGILTPTFLGAPGAAVTQYSIDITNPTGYQSQTAGQGAPSSAPLGDFLNNVTSAAFILGGVLLLVYLLFGAFKYMSAGGDDKAVTSAKNMLTNAVIGILIMAVSFFIVRILGTVLGLPNILNPTFQGP